MNNRLKDIHSLLTEAVQSLSKNYKGSSLTDVFLLVDEASAELSIYDDEQNCVAQGIIEGWESDGQQDVSYVGDLKKVIQNMDNESAFSALDVYTPFSINLADEDFIVIEELLLIDDDSIIRMEDDFLKRMDKEFDEFLERLLKED